MTPQPLAQAKDPDLWASLHAIQRAAAQARQTALQTETAIVIFENQQIIRLSAQQLRQQRPVCPTSSTLPPKAHAAANC